MYNIAFRKIIIQEKNKTFVLKSFIEQYRYIYT